MGILPERKDVIIYENTKGGLINDIQVGCIASKVRNVLFEEHNIAHSDDGEYRVWGIVMGRYERVGVFYKIMIDQR